MTVLGEYRQKYPDYADMSDQQLADALHKKFYADMPKASFYKKVGAPISWSDVGSGAIQSAVPSAIKMAGDIGQAIVHPVDTAKSMGTLALGGLEKGYEGYGGGPLAKAALGAINPLQGAYNAARGAGLFGDTGSGQSVEQAGEFLKDRYGGLENIKHTLATDPVGALGDVSLLASGGGGLAARAPALASRVGTAANIARRVGQAGEIAQKVGSAIDPVTIATKTIPKAAAHLGTEIVGGLGAHTGGQALRTAFGAGVKGGEAARAFRENMRDVAPMEDTVAHARQGLEQLRNQRGSAYRAGMVPVANDKTILSFNDIDAALQRGRTAFYAKETNPVAARVRQEMWDVVDDYRNSQASLYHTAEGFDAMKQRLGAIREETQPGTKARLVANDIYHAVRKTIIAQSPEYAKVMKGYEAASKQLREIEKTLGLGERTITDTALRKLQSTLRDNVNTSFGRRKELAEYLAENGSPQLMEMLAGQALKPWTPRGLGKLLGGELLFGHGAGLGVMGMLSPRALGEASYYGGVASRYPARVGKAITDRVSSRAIGQSAYRLGALQDDAKERLKDKSKPLAKDERDTLRAVANGTATVDQRVKADAFLKRFEGDEFSGRFGGQQPGGQRAPLRMTVHPRPTYGGPQ